jgi:micrococcal nuclease
MRKLWCLGLLAAAMLCAGVVVVVAQTSHKVTRIVDGDTLVLSEIGIVRLIGVDTPETDDQRGSVREFGKQSKEFLSFLTLNTAVRIEYDQTRKDRYGRTLAYLYLPDGRFVNREIIRNGYGHAYVKYPFKFMADFQAAGQQAKKAGVGLWAVRLGPEDILTAPSTAPAPGVMSAAGPVPARSATASRSNGQVTVYVTKTGEKYHKDGCRSLSRSQIAMTLKEASARYEPCSVCRPPVLSDTFEPRGAMPVTSAARGTPTSAPRIASQQCAATTKAGARCKRTASAGSANCWQHDVIH